MNHIEFQQIRKIYSNMKNKVTASVSNTALLKIP